MNGLVLLTEPVFAARLNISNGVIIIFIIGRFLKPPLDEKIHAF